MLTRVLKLPDPLIEYTLLKLPPRTLCQLLLVSSSIGKPLLPFIYHTLRKIEDLKKIVLMHWETNSTISQINQIPPTINKLLNDISMIYTFIQEGGVYNNPVTDSIITLHRDNQIMYIHGTIFNVDDPSHHVLVYPTRTYIVNSYIYELNTENPGISIFPYESRITEAFFTEEQVFVLDRAVLAISEEGIESLMPEHDGWLILASLPRSLKNSLANTRPFPVVVQGEVFILYFAIMSNEFLRLVYFNRHNNTFQTIMVTGHTPIHAHTILDLIYVPDNSNQIMILPSRANYRMTIMALTITTLNKTDIYAKWSTVTMPPITTHEYFTYIIRRDVIELYYIDKRDPFNKKTSYKLRVLEVDNDSPLA